MGGMTAGYVPIKALRHTMLARRCADVTSPVEASSSSTCAVTLPRLAGESVRNARQTSSQRQGQTPGRDPFVLRVSTEEIEASVPLPPSGIIIGGDVTSDIVVREPWVSKREVRVVPEADVVLVTPLTRTCGMRLRGEPVLKTLPMRRGDVLEMAGVAFTLL